MINKIEVGKKYMYDYDVIEVLAVGKEKVFYEYTEKEDEPEFIKYISYALEHWNELERETITLTERVCRYGNIRFLTEDLEFVSCSKFEQKVLKKTLDAEGYKCHKAPNARSYKVYADTLERVKE